MAASGFSFPDLETQLPSLPAVSSLLPPSPGLPSSSSGSGASDILTKIGAAIGDSVIPGGSAVSQMLGTGSASFSITRIVAVLVGLILIAAGVFSFSGGRDIIVSATKAVAAA